VGTLGAFLTAVSGPLAKRVLAALGFGVVSYVGLDVAVSSALSAAQASWAGMPSDVAAYVAYGGGGTALSIICGGITGRVAFMSLKRLSLL